ncbi:MAG: TerC family protein [Hyphomicrobiales bacterium]|nr:TerC family protein [Hyphomicrobiales bacterium]
MSFAWAGDLQIWAALLTLTAIEIVLGIDNIILVSVLADRLPLRRQAPARRLGLMLALAARLTLLAGIVWVTKLTEPVLEGFGHRLSARDLILIAGGIFLVYSGTREIHAHIEGSELDRQPPSASARFARIVAQMVMLDLVFSLDSIITAVGMANEFWVMAAAIVIAMAVMLAMAEPVARFINRRPTVKVLVLSFLLVIGVALVADGFGLHVPRGYIYAAVGFSIGVEALNQLARRRRGRNRERTATQNGRRGGERPTG